jgi:alpha-ketoglutarate-dependent taurine dioxygenase
MGGLETTRDHNGALVAELAPADVRELASRGRLPADTADGLRRAAGTALAGFPGYVRVNGLGILPADRLETAFAALCRVFGRLISQDREGTVVRRVEDRGTKIGEGARARYADSRFGGSLHTDGAELPQPVPGRFALLCVEQAPVGGELNLVHMSRLETRLTAAERARLRRPFHFDRRGDQLPGEDPTVRKAVLFDGGPEDGTCVTYLREYVERGHCHPHTPPLTGEDRAALDALDGALGAPELQLTIRMNAGETAVFNNLRILHGRTTFEDDPHRRRLLMRTWIQPGPGTPAGEVTA